MVFICRCWPCSVLHLYPFHLCTHLKVAYDLGRAEDGRGNGTGKGADGDEYRI